MTRPIIIDERDGACEICADWRTKPEGFEGNAHFCNKCKEQLPQMLNMQGNGYLSPRPDHFHLRPVLGINGREALYAELCADCYLDIFKEVNPNAPLPESVVIYSTKHKFESKFVEIKKEEISDEQPADLSPTE